MTEQAKDLLPDYVLGVLDDAQRAEVDAAVAASAELQAELAAVTEDLAGLADGLTPLVPAPDVKLRLMDAVKQDRFLPFADDLARFCDMAFEKMRDILRLVDKDEAWEAGPMPGIRLIHFDPGPQCFAADTGLVEMPAGFAFPRHEHTGREVNYILQGGLIDEDGTHYGPGEYCEKAKGNPHGFKVADEGVLVMVVMHNGFDILA